MDTGTPIQVRLEPDQLSLLDEWIQLQPEPMTRPEGLRQIAGTALKTFKRNQELYRPAVEAYLRLRTIGLGPKGNT